MEGAIPPDYLRFVRIAGPKLHFFNTSQYSCERGTSISPSKIQDVVTISFPAEGGVLNFWPYTVAALHRWRWRVTPFACFVVRCLVHNGRPKLPRFQGVSSLFFLVFQWWNQASSVRMRFAETRYSRMNRSRWGDQMVVALMLFCQKGILRESLWSPRWPQTKEEFEP